MWREVVISSWSGRSRWIALDAPLVRLKFWYELVSQNRVLSLAPAAPGEAKSMYNSLYGVLVPFLPPDP